MCSLSRRIWTRHRPRPKPCNDGQLLPDVLLQGRAVLGHFLGDLHLGIEMPDAFLGLVAHPLAVVADVGGEALGAVPDGGGLFFLALLLPVGIHRRPAGELGRNLDQGLGDQHRHRVEIAGVGPEAQPLRLQRNRTAAAEGIEHRRSVFGQEGVHHLGRGQPINIKMVARAFELLVDAHESRPAVAAFHEVLGRHSLAHGRVLGELARLDEATRDTAGDLGPGGADDVVVVRVLPLHQLLDEVEQVGPFRGRRFEDGAIGQPVVGIAVGIIDERGEQHGPASRERPPCPPEMESARMPMPNRLLPRRRLVDGFERQGDFDEFLSIFHFLVQPKAFPFHEVRPRLPIQVNYSIQRPIRHYAA